MERKFYSLLLFALAINSICANDLVEYSVEHSSISMCSAPSAKVIPTVSSYFSNIFTTKYWPDRWLCGNCSNAEGWLFISSDLSIFLACLSILVMLLWFLRKRKLGKLRWVVGLFGSFILLCGFTHLIDVVIFWEPVYWLSVLAKIQTGVASLAAAIVLGFVIPKAMEYKSPDELQVEIDDLIIIQNQFENFIKHSLEAVAMVDKEIMYLMSNNNRSNNNRSNNYALNEKDIVGKSYYEILPLVEKDKQTVEFHYRALRGEYLCNDLEVLAVDGVTKYVKWQIHSWYTVSDKIGGFMFFSENLTDEVVLEQKQENTQQRMSYVSKVFEEVSDLANFGIWSVELPTNMAVWSDAVYRIHKLEIGTEIKVEDGINYYHEDHSDLIREANYNSISKRQTWDFELKIIGMKGKKKLLRAKVRPVYEDKGVMGLDGLIQDIYDTKTQQLELHYRACELLTFNQKFELASDAAGFGIWGCDVAKNEMIWDDHMRQIYAINENRFSSEYESWRNGRHPDDQERSDREAKNVFGGTAKSDAQFSVVLPDGKNSYLKALAEVFGDENDKSIRMLGINRDVIEQVRKEEKTIERNRDLKSKVEELTKELQVLIGEIEAFSYSVSYHSRAPTRAINRFASALAEDLTDVMGEAALPYLNRIISNSEKMGNLIDDLLEFSRLNCKKTDFIKVDLDHICLKLIRERFIDSKSKIETGTLSRLLGDLEMLNQVLMNLMSNAVKNSFKIDNPQINISAEEDNHFLISVMHHLAGFYMTNTEKLLKFFKDFIVKQNLKLRGVRLHFVQK